MKLVLCESNGFIKTYFLCFFRNLYSQSVANSKFHSSASPCHSLGHSARGLVCGDI